MGDASSVDADLAQALIEAGRALAWHGLVDAFGHVSVRLPHERSALITPPVPLGRLASTKRPLVLSLEDETLPPGVPREAWIHWSILRTRPDVGAVCRAQPPHVLAAAAAGVTVRALHGQGAFVGAEVPELDDARLVRDRAAGERLTAALGAAPALVMRGNGAVTIGDDVGAAVARMYVLDASARINLAARASGDRRPLSPAELSAWERAAPELLARLWEHLRSPA